MQAFDEARFGASRTLNLRAHLPSATQAVTRVESWLREQQVARAGDVLIITGRGNNSPGGISVVRAAVSKRLTVLRRQGVVRTVREHSPGAFAVSLAPISALVDAAPRSGRASERAPTPDPALLAGISPTGRTALRALAVRSLEELGAGALAERLVVDEMVRLFGRLSASVRDAADPDAALCAAVDAALDEMDAR